MATASQRYSFHRLLIVALSLVSLLFSFHAVAGEQQERPWGRLDKPAVNAAQAQEQKGYLGRYNPWSNGATTNPSDEPPRYRNRDNTNSKRNNGAYNSYGNSSAPSTQFYAPYESGYPYASNREAPYRGAPYSGSPYSGAPYSRAPYSGAPYGGTNFSPMQGLAPWNGGLNPDYGNYLNDPYDSLHPDTGILWSDMWRR